MVAGGSDRDGPPVGGPIGSVPGDGLAWHRRRRAARCQRRGHPGHRSRGGGAGRGGVPSVGTSRAARRAAEQRLRVEVLLAAAEPEVEPSPDRPTMAPAATTSPVGGGRCRPARRTSPAGRRRARRRRSGCRRRRPLKVTVPGRRRPHRPCPAARRSRGRGCRGTTGTAGRGSGRRSVPRQAGSRQDGGAGWSAVDDASTMSE